VASFLPNIRFGTERYPEQIARRLRALNLTTWIASTVAAGFAIQQFLGATSEMRTVAWINAVAAPICAVIPLLHRFGALAAPFGLIIVAYTYFFVVIVLLGNGTGMQWYYLVGTALAALFFGTERPVLALIFSLVSAAIVITLEFLVPRNTGLQSEVGQFASFVATVAVCCVLLLLIVSYALREAARAETLAERERARSDSLLSNILPSRVADRLKDRKESVIADRFDEASILFADMAGFTARASDSSPEDLVHFLNGVFSEFDRLVERHGLEKIKTTGDSYMVVSGVPVPRADHPEALAQLALDMRTAAAQMQGLSVPIRIGIASGPVVAGVVGSRKFFYDVWGDAVNVASRMESNGVAGKIQVAESTALRLRDEFVLKERGLVEIKGKGSMRTWFLYDRKPRAMVDVAAGP